LSPAAVGAGAAGVRPGVEEQARDGRVALVGGVGEELGEALDGQALDQERQRLGGVLVQALLGRGDAIAAGGVGQQRPHPRQRAPAGGAHQIEVGVLGAARAGLHQQRGDLAAAQRLGHLQGGALLERGEGVGRAALQERAHGVGRASLDRLDDRHVAVALLVRRGLRAALVGVGARGQQAPDDVCPGGRGGLAQRERAEALDADVAGEAEQELDDLEASVAGRGSEAVGGGAVEPLGRPLAVALARLVDVGLQLFHAVQSRTHHGERYLRPSTISRPPLQ